MAITHVYGNGSGLPDLLGDGHIVAGTVTTGAGADAVLTTNDRSAVLTRAAAGNYTITFGEPFVAAPAAYLCPKGAFADDSMMTCQVVSMSTAALNFSLIKTTLKNATATNHVAALSDGEATDSVHFIVVGKRYN